MLVIVEFDFSFILFSTIGRVRFKFVTITKYKYQTKTQAHSANFALSH